MILNNNKKFLLVLLCGFSSFFSAKAQLFIDKSAKVNIFSSTPIEDIKAVSNTAVSVLQFASQDIVMQLIIKSLDFDKKLMQQHFNEDYMESDKFPTAKFKGTIEPKIPINKDGEYNVVAKGILNVHGIDQARNINGKLTVKNGTISFNAAFDVACASHNIKIPSLVFTKVAEIIQVKIQSNLNALK